MWEASSDLGVCRAWSVGNHRLLDKATGLTAKMELSKLYLKPFQL
jgi:hypothetical protein